MKTKKTIILFLVLFILFLMIFFITKTLLKTNSNNPEFNTTITNDFSTTDNADKFLIDYNYEERKKSVKSNAELTSLNEEFANIWREKSDFYYQEIYDYFVLQDDTAMINKTQLMKEEWDTYYICQMDYYEEFMISTYNSGSIVPIKMSSYSLLLNRNKAVELYNLCLNLGLEVKTP